MEQHYFHTYGRQTSLWHKDLRLVTVSHALTALPFSFFSGSTISHVYDNIL